jgi:hypothetical protein
VRRERSKEKPAISSSIDQHYSSTNREIEIEKRERENERD